VGGSSTVVRWKPGSSGTFALKELKSKEDVGGVRGLASNPDGSVWVGIDLPGRGKGLQQLVQGSWKPFITPELDGSTLEVQTLLLDAKTLFGLGHTDRAFTAFMVAT